MAGRKNTNRGGGLVRKKKDRQRNKRQRNSREVSGGDVELGDVTATAAARAAGGNNGVAETTWTEVALAFVGGALLMAGATVAAYYLDLEVVYRPSDAEIVAIAGSVAGGLVALAGEYIFGVRKKTIKGTSNTKRIAWFVTLGLWGVSMAGVFGSKLFKDGENQKEIQRLGAAVAPALGFYVLAVAHSKDTAVSTFSWMDGATVRSVSRVSGIWGYLAAAFGVCACGLQWVSGSFLTSVAGAFVLFGYVLRLDAEIEVDLDPSKVVGNSSTICLMNNAGLSVDYMPSGRGRAALFARGKLEFDDPIGTSMHANVAVLEEESVSMRAVLVVARKARAAAERKAAICDTWHYSPFTVAEDIFAVVRQGTESTFVALCETCLLCYPFVDAPTTDFERMLVRFMFAVARGVNDQFSDKLERCGPSAPEGQHALLTAALVELQDMLSVPADELDVLVAGAADDLGATMRTVWGELGLDGAERPGDAAAALPLSSGEALRPNEQDWLVGVACLLMRLDEYPALAEEVKLMADPADGAAVNARESLAYTANVLKKATLIRSVLLAQGTIFGTALLGEIFSSVTEEG